MMSVLKERLVTSSPVSHLLMSISLFRLWNPLIACYGVGRINEMPGVTSTNIKCLNKFFPDVSRRLLTKSYDNVPSLIGGYLQWYVSGRSVDKLEFTTRVHSISEMPLEHQLLPTISETDNQMPS